MCDVAAQFKHYPGTYHGFAIRGDRRGKDTRDATIRESQAEVRCVAHCAARLCVQSEATLLQCVCHCPVWLRDLPMHCKSCRHACLGRSHLRVAQLCGRQCLARMSL